jgi:hypothetical protein
LSANSSYASYRTLIIMLDPEALVPAQVPPTWNLSATEGEPGMTLTVSGDHWWPADSVIVEYCRAGSAQPTALGMRCFLGPRGTTTAECAAHLGRAVVDAGGHFTATITLPTNAKPGEIIVEARLLGENERAQVYFASRALGVRQPASYVTPLPTLRQDWWPQAPIGGLLIEAALFVFCPRIMRGIGRRPAPAALANPTTAPLEGDDDDE